MNPELRIQNLSKSLALLLVLMHCEKQLLNEIGNVIAHCVLVGCNGNDAAVVRTKNHWNVDLCGRRVDGFKVNIASWEVFPSRSGCKAKSLHTMQLQFSLNHDFCLILWSTRRWIVMPLHSGTGNFLFF